MIYVNKTAENMIQFNNMMCIFKIINHKQLLFDLDKGTVVWVKVTHSWTFLDLYPTTSCEDLGNSFLVLPNPFFALDETI